MKKIFALFISIVLISTLFMGCAKSPESNNFKNDYAAEDYFADEDWSDGEAAQNEAVSSRKLIKENIKNFSSFGERVWIRMPIIPGVNDSLQHIQRAGEELSACGFSGKIELLAFHRLGAHKYKALGEEYDFEKAELVTDEKMQMLRNALANYNLHVEGGVK